MMGHVLHISQSILSLSFTDNFTTDISEWLHIANVNEAYPWSNNVNHIGEMLQQNDQWTDLDYIQETLSYLLLQDS